MNLRISMIIALVSVSIIMLGLSIFAWRRKDVGRPAIFLSLCLAGVAIYSFGYGMEIASDTFAFAKFWVRFQHWGIQLIAPTWLLFSLGVTGHKKHITTKLIIALSIIPIYLFLTTQTLGWLNLAHHNPRMDTSGAFPLFTYDRNLFNYIAIGYYSLCLGISTILFVIMILRSAPSFRKHASIYLIGSLPPWIGSVLHNLNLFRSNLDFSPLTLGLGGLILAYGFFKFRVLDIIPLARDVVFENMDAGILILDHKDRIIDFNPVLQDIFPELNASLIGSSVYEFLLNYPTLYDFVKENNPEKDEYKDSRGQTALCYRVSLSPMISRDQRLIGKIISFYDFTLQKQLMEKLGKLAALDGLTGVYNRQHFDQLVSNELSRLQRYGGVLSLIMFDLDNFKQINDAYGHEAGDVALVSLIENLRKILRDSDLMARFGGDEFMVLLPQTDLSAGCVLAERLKQQMNDLSIDFNDHVLKLSASFGVTGINSDSIVSLKDLYRYTDQAMYRAKNLGGDRVSVFLPSESQ
jgi:diguanylate cyclase (GGDEF)-like protein